MRNWFNKQKRNLHFHQRALLIVLGVFGSFFAYVFSKILLIRPDGVYIGQPNSWSDWVVHISITNIFANKPVSEWFLYHPFFAQGKLTYGFLVHLITALFMRIGFSLPISFYIVSILLTFAFLTGLYFLYFQISNSRKASVLAIFLFLTSSGMGIFRYWNKLSLPEILTPMLDYSRYLEYDWLAGNIPAAMILPQRAFFIGVTIGVWVLNLLLWGIEKTVVKKESNTKKLAKKLAIKLNKKLAEEQRIELLLPKKLLFLAGVLAGILPVAHMHSFIVIIIVTGIICVVNAAKFRPLIKIISIYYVLPATLISLTLFYIFIYSGIQVDDFMKISLGWTASGGLLAWIVMWLKLWGTFLPAAFFALWLFRKKLNQSKQLEFITGFLAVFVLGNIIVFQPTEWDNTKLFAWVYLGLSILVAQLLIKLANTSTIHKVIALMLFLTLSATGAVELLRIINFDPNTHLLSTTSEISLAERIAQNTNTDAIFLTSTAHNHPIPLWAHRPIFLGYLGWVKNFGFDPSSRIDDSYQIFTGKPTANQLIKTNKISYIFVGPKEKSEYNINVDYLNQFPVAFENQDTTVYDSRSLWQ